MIRMMATSNPMMPTTFLLYLDERRHVWPFRP